MNALFQSSQPPPGPAGAAYTDGSSRYPSRQLYQPFVQPGPVYFGQQQQPPPPSSVPGFSMQPSQDPVHRHSKCWALALSADYFTGVGKSRGKLIHVSPKNYTDLNGNTFRLSINVCIDLFLAEPLSVRMTLIIPVKESRSFHFTLHSILNSIHVSFYFTPHSLPFLFHSISDLIHVSFHFTSHSKLNSVDVSFHLKPHSLPFMFHSI